MTGEWYVYDPEPADPSGRGPMLVGPFPTKAEADKYANVAHDEDGSGNTVVLKAEAP